MWYETYLIKQAYTATELGSLLALMSAGGLYGAIRKAKETPKDKSKLLPILGGAAGGAIAGAVGGVGGGMLGGLVGGNLRENLTMPAALIGAAGGGLGIPYAIYRSRKPAELEEEKQGSRRRTS